MMQQQRLATLHLFFSLLLLFKLHPTVALRPIRNHNRKSPSVTPSVLDRFSFFSGGATSKSRGKSGPINKKHVQRRPLRNKKQVQKSSQLSFAANFFDLLPPHILPGAWLLHEFLEGDENRFALLGYLLVSAIFLPISKLLQQDSSGKPNKMRDSANKVKSNRLMYGIDILACCVLSDEPMLIILFLSIISFVMMGLGTEKTSKLLKNLKSQLTSG